MDENIEVILHDDGLSATVYTPSIRARGSHKHGLNVIAALDIMLWLRARLFSESGTFLSKLWIDGAGNFLLGTFLTIHEAFYTFHKQTIGPDDIIRHSLKFDSYIDQVRNTSYTINNRCYDRETGDILIEERSTFSWVNLTTRRPQRFPEELRQIANNSRITSLTKMADFSWSKSDFDVKQEDIVTSETFPIEVTQKDIDFNLHVNFLVYPKNAVSCLKEVLGSNDSRKIACKHLSILYADEALKGDVLDYRIHIARNADVYVHIYRHDKCINKMKMTSFYNVKPDALKSFPSRL